MSTNVTAALAALAGKIDKSRFSVRHVEYRNRPALRVVSLGATTLTDTIVAQNDGGTAGSLIPYREVEVNSVDGSGVPLKASIEMRRHLPAGACPALS
jgi:hypothetical protein